jgi:hypothetical protein
MERLLERCVSHARERAGGDVPIGRHQSISHRIADMELDLESARLLLYRAAWHKWRRGTATRESALAKLAVSEAYVKCCRGAMQIFGGYGYTVDFEDRAGAPRRPRQHPLCRNIRDPEKSDRRPQRPRMIRSPRASNLRSAGFVLATILAFLAPCPTAAHTLGQSYLYLQIYEESVSGRFEIALSDFNAALGFVGSEAEITPENLDERIGFLRDYYREHVTISKDGQPIPLEFTDYEILPARGGFLQLAFDLPALDSVPESLSFDYSVLFAEEPAHRGFLLVEHNWATGIFANESQISEVFRPDATRQTLDLTTSSRWKGFLVVVRLGIEHIWMGWDHVMFLIALLLPSVLRRENGQWRGVERFGPALVHVVKIVTAFTVAHSITLSLAALDLVHVPGRLVEVVIAASIAIAAADLLVPIFKERLWWIVVGFGLFHGFGFAGALSEMGVLHEHRGLALFAFNLGVEIGQVAIVAVLVPLFFIVRRMAMYRVVVLRAAAVGMILISSTWVIERAFDVDIPMWELIAPAVAKIVL